MASGVRGKSFGVPIGSWTKSRTGDVPRKRKGDSTEYVYFGPFFAPSDPRKTMR